MIPSMVHPDSTRVGIMGMPQASSQFPVISALLVKLGPSTDVHIEVVSLASNCQKNREK